MHYLITGATGFVGGHLAEACNAKGDAVTAIVRPQSDTKFLEGLGAKLVRGNFGDAEIAREALTDADVVVHCAAKVGDRGPVDEYRAVNVHAVERFLEACLVRHKERPLQRIVHISSLGVYEARHHHGTTEEVPPAERHLDGYSHTKVEQEKLVLKFQREHGLPIVVLRPGFIYGPRDRIVLPKIIAHMHTGKVHFLGADQRAQNTIFVLNLIDAIFLAVEKGKPGEVYNLTDGELVTKERFFGTIADGMGLPRSKQVLPRWLAAFVVRMVKRQMERAVRNGKKPWLTPGKFKFLQLNLDFSIEKAKRELGYEPRFNFDDGMRETLAWYQKNPEVVQSLVKK